jgi:hypothetical protein
MPEGKKDIIIYKKHKSFQQQPVALPVEIKVS